MSLPLSDVRVVEFSHMVMGPTTGLVLADLGADVIKIEPIEGGDKTRRLPGAGAGYFSTYNRNKRSFSVDLKSAEGRALVQKLIATADVVTENFRPGALDRMGFGYDNLAVDHPGLIYCSLKGFLPGPYENRTALDEVVQMMGGLAYMTGPPGQPLRAGASVNDVMGGVFGAVAIIAALHERARTGQGQLVKSALFENNAFLMGQHLAQFAVTGVPARPMPVRKSAWAVYDVFTTEDEQKVFIGVVSDRQWQIFCSAFDLSDLSNNHELKTNTQRVQNRDTFMPRLRRAVGARTLAETIALCEKSDLPFAPINKPEDLLDDPHLAEPGAMVHLTSDGKNVAVPALPIAFGARRFGVRMDVPLAGEHTASIAAELGIGDEQLGHLADSGIIETSVRAGVRHSGGLDPQLPFVTREQEHGTQTDHDAAADAVHS
ncbi:formyl-CoA transferase [Rhodococcus sp. 06-412-2C]|uniref:CaiB/BaiF CoA transferase family protein n=1 Tax=unclassified Rhodococcus (in: high G+C Gram-positive bacteria) TaxID=192944 RepID=UPI000B9B8027|nr:MULTISPECIES: CaiB/BaiF CoA-transferase family protein [unclassified Rhodococcus (in: high G+C Gram-positive bacteria)]OZC87166.1 formyl-CoA transferase [Rhodococcus sp. 06-412-2C]OZD00606.1 formyl-CoA transferase [Rhodococcus sp. 06-412-2B]